MGITQMSSEHRKVMVETRFPAELLFTVTEGTAHSEPKQATALRKGGYAMLKERHPCKILDIKVSTTGKHGHSKCRIIGSDLFTGARIEDLCVGTHMIECPIVTKVDFPARSATSTTVHIQKAAPVGGQVEAVEKPVHEKKKLS